jgi:hypothetical protein
MHILTVYLPNVTDVTDLPQSGIRHERTTLM